MKRKILDIQLESFWLFLIETGIKRQDYKEINDKWRSILFDDEGEPIRYTHVRFRYFDRIDERATLYTFKGVTTGKGDPLTGASRERDMYIIQIGRRVASRKRRIGKRELSECLNYYNSKGYCLGDVEEDMA